MFEYVVKLTKIEASIMNTRSCFQNNFGFLHIASKRFKTYVSRYLYFQIPI